MSEHEPIPDDGNVEEGREVVSPEADALITDFLATRGRERRLASTMAMLARRRMLHLIADWHEEFEGRRARWLATRGIEIADLTMTGEDGEEVDDGFALLLGDDIYMIEPGEGETVLLNGKPWAPTPLFFTPENHRRLEARIDAWAKRVRTN